jgi:hypothetical protein
MTDFREPVSEDQSGAAGLLMALGGLGLFWASVIVEVVRCFRLV